MIVLFGSMMGGFGDLIAFKEVKQMLERRFPTTPMRGVICIPSHLSCELDATTIPLFYTHKVPSPDAFPQEVKALFSSSSLVLALPALYPHLAALQELAAGPCIAIGQYGMVRSLHPFSGHYSMGLHPLEIGILTREPQESSLSHPWLQTLLREPFYLAYLFSKERGGAYLHALLYAEESSFDLCTPDLGWLIGYIQQQKERDKPLLEGDHGVGTLEIHLEGHHTERIYLSDAKKRVRILCPLNLSDGDFRHLMRKSLPCVAVRGDQSFSEAVSAARPFFYDSAPWGLPFLEDLHQLSPNYLHEHSQARRFLQLTYELHHPSGSCPLAIAREMGALIRSKEMHEGFSHLSQALTTYHSCNEALCTLIKPYIEWP